MAKGRPRKAGKREANGRIVRQPIKQKHLDEMRPVLEERCRAMGWKKEPVMNAKMEVIGEAYSPSNMRRVRAEQFGCEAGRMLEREMKPDQVQDYFTAVKHIRLTVTRYLKAIEAPNPDPRGMDLGYIPEGEASDDVPPLSLRSEEERVKSATSAYMALEGWLGRVGPRERQEALRVVLRDEKPKSDMSVILCLASVIEGMAGR